nr:MAG TPA: hypothetical protein [Caudoviricetes sp.]
MQLTFGGLFFFAQKLVNGDAEVIGDLLECCIGWHRP